MKIGGWTRLGIVVSVLWIALALMTACYEFFMNAPFGEFMFVRFIDNGPPIGRFNPVRAELDMGRLTLISLAPIAVFWFSGFVTWRAFRWVKAGFES